MELKRSGKLVLALWIVVYIIFILAPLGFMFIGERPAGREFLRELSVAFGFVGIGLMALHFVLTARITAVKAPFGSDVIYFFHHRVAYLTAALWLAHPIILFIRYPWARRLLNLLEAPWRARWGVLSVVAILALMVLAIWRRPFRMEYVLWRITHGILASVAMILVMVHAFMVGNFIGTPTKQILWIGYGAIAVALVVYLRVYKPWMMLRKPYEVAEVRAERGQVWSLALQPAGHEGLRFQPGQFAWITARHSPFAAHEHPFSFSSSAEREDRVEFAIKALGDFTATIGELPKGQHVYIDGPYGSFSPDRYQDVGMYVFIAGGVGIAPMMSILRTMEDRGGQTPALLFYGNQEWDDVAFREELEELQDQLDLEVVHVLERPPDDWEGEVGYVTRDMLARYLPKDIRYRVFICGPLGMLTAVEGSLKELDVPESMIHLERFDLA